MIWILCLIVGLGNLNTILMSVMERRREFGMMRAVGMKPNQVVLNVVYESAAISFIGILVGSILGTLSHFSISFILVTI